MAQRQACSPHRKTNEKESHAGLLFTWPSVWAQGHETVSDRLVIISASRWESMKLVCVPAVPQAYAPEPLSATPLATWMPPDAQTLQIEMETSLDRLE
jgi:hypothetical protein